MNKAKQKNNYWQYKYPLCILSALLILCIVGGVVAKYIYDNQGDNIAKAKEFYFSSDLLTEDCHEYILNANSTEISFTIGNNIDELRYSDDDINFTVTVEGGGQLNIESGTLANGRVSRTKIILSQLEKGKTYTVTAIGEAGYKQTLRAKFTVEDNDVNVYKYLDVSNENYVLLTVWTENLIGDLCVSFSQNGLIPDNTDPVLAEVFNYTNDEYTAFSFEDGTSFSKGYSSHTYRFFIDAAENVTVDMFDVKINQTYIAKAEIPK